MKIHHTKLFAMGSIIVITAMMVAPANSVDPVVTANEAQTGTIHVVSVVINDNMGTKLPSDFIFTVKHWGSDVVGSPFPGTGLAGTTFVVSPGTYVVSTPVIDGYNGLWSGIGIENGFIDLQPGQEITIIRTSKDVGVEAIGAVTPLPTTEDGGELPATATPWLNALVAGLLLSVAGAFGARSSLNFN